MNRLTREEQVRARQLKDISQRTDSREASGAARSHFLLKGMWNVSSLTAEQIISILMFSQRAAGDVRESSPHRRRWIFLQRDQPRGGRTEMVSAKFSTQRVLDARKDGKGQDRQKAMEQALTQVEKQFGKGAIMRLGESQVVDIDVVPTGCLSLDAALGIGGVPRGRVIEMYGPESAGKTMCALNMIAQAQKQGGIAAFIDAEHALDVSFARKLGVDVENLLVAQPDCGEEALEITDTLVRSGALDIIVRRFRGGAGSAGGARRGDGRRPDGAAGAADVAGVEKADGIDTEVANDGDLHQPVAHEDRRDVRQPGNHDRGARPLLLRFGANGYPQHRQHQGRRRGNRPTDPGESGPRTRSLLLSGRPSSTYSSAGMTSVSPKRETCSIWEFSTGSSRRAEPGSRTADCALGQGRENARIFLKENEQVSGRIEEEIRAAMNIPLARAAAGEDAGAAAGKTPAPTEGTGSAPGSCGRYSGGQRRQRQGGSPEGGTAQSFRGKTETGGGVNRKPAAQAAGYSGENCGS